MVTYSNSNNNNLSCNIRDIFRHFRLIAVLKFWSGPGFSLHYYNVFHTIKVFWIFWKTQDFVPYTFPLYKWLNKKYGYHHLALNSSTFVAVTIYTVYWPVSRSEIENLTEYLRTTSEAFLTLIAMHYHWCVSGFCWTKFENIPSPTRGF